MTKYKAIILNTELDSENNRFTEQCIEEMAQPGSVIPVVRDFNECEKIGDAYKLEFDGINLECEIESDLDITPNLVSAIAFIAESSHSEDDVKVYDKVRLYSIGFTCDPATPNTSIERLECG